MLWYIRVEAQPVDVDRLPGLKRHLKRRPSLRREEAFPVFPV